MAVLVVRSDVDDPARLAAAGVTRVRLGQPDLHLPTAQPSAWPWRGRRWPRRDAANATFAATLGVVGGTGRYLAASGTGTFVRTRTTSLGRAVAATFDLSLDGLK